MPGPTATTTHPALTPARLRVLQGVADAPAPVTLADLAGRLGGHPNTTRQHLDALAAESLVSITHPRRDKPGRRPQAFAVTESGRRALAGRDPEASVVGAFAGYLVHRGRPAEEARAVGEVWAEDGIAALDAADGPVDGLVRVLDMLGFAPTRTDDGTRPAVVLRSCPLLDQAERRPEVICELHRGMIDGVVRRLGASGGVSLEPFSDPDGCRVSWPPLEPPDPTPA